MHGYGQVSIKLYIKSGDVLDLACKLWCVNPYYFAHFFVEISQLVISVISVGRKPLIVNLFL